MNKKILVVDDDQYLRELYEEILKSEGYEVETAQHGREGLSKLHQGGYDFVLLDVMLPEIDGLGILDDLSQNHPSKPNGPIILLTNLANDPLIEQAKIKGASDCLVKADITPQDLIDFVKKYLS